MSALICGSVAFDTIMVFNDRFRNHILPDKVHVLSVSFLVPSMRKEFGGCAGNIAYNLKMLGGEPLPMATVGTDFDKYGEWMDRWGINRRHISIIDSEFTAQAFITTDLDDNQITAFHPGAMNFSHLNDVNDADGVTIGMISPDGRDGMLQHAQQFADADIPFVFDPSQSLPLYDGEDLRDFIELASWVTVNDYEWELIRDRTGLSETDMRERVKALVVTQGAKGSIIYADKQTVEIPPARADGKVDPTGCGDAYRAGLLYGLMNDMDWETSGRLASLMGAIKVSQPGTQNHSFERDECCELYEESFGRRLDL